MSARSVGVLLLGTFLLTAVPAGCSRGPERGEGTADAWEELPPPRFPSHPAATFLKSRCIGIDPGHGGDEDAEKQVEARANLEVALELKRFLERDGAIVRLTRDRDVKVSLAERPKRLQEEGAEIIISIHHNASSHEDANYTSTWYHLDPDREPACLDLARCIQSGVMEALRTPLSVPTPILSDHLLYQNGFAVLRGAQVPAVLCEASFYTNPDERRRLERNLYLRREAYGYYIGIVHYFAGGTPAPSILEVRTLHHRGPDAAAAARIICRLEDGLQGRGGWGSKLSRVLPSSIDCRLDGRLLDYDYDAKESVLTITLPEVKGRAHLSLRFQNLYKNSSFPTRFIVTRSASGEVRVGSDIELAAGVGGR